MIAEYPYNIRYAALWLTIHNKPGRDADEQTADALVYEVFLDREEDYDEGDDSQPAPAPPPPKTREKEGNR